MGAQSALRGRKQIVFLATDAQDKEKDERVMQYGAVRYQSTVHDHNSLFFMAVDLWLMIEADIYLPNVLSSVDWNVCAARFARGRDCYNFFLNPHITP
eukprot:NODE_9359_length_372_cov_31.083591_g8456_i0.p2 GENE.NODE_9359_length_372_cov_31.083591_g8456_i0~~NODE_9359_length_372_cov_31.083591_g8456_i0.p2  ORF type:complete len:107 (-),score=36.51 NODE_9359_length_372_cov_31.083591_g8456_i0:50-343(-)